jgi:hypothetical protein
VLYGIARRRARDATNFRDVSAKEITFFFVGLASMPLAASKWYYIAA